MTKDVYFWFMISAVACGTESIIISLSDNMYFVLISGIIAFSIAFAAFGSGIIVMIKNRKKKDEKEKEIASPHNTSSTE